MDLSKWKKEPTPKKIPFSKNKQDELDLTSLDIYPNERNKPYEVRLKAMYDRGEITQEYYKEILKNRSNKEMMRYSWKIVI